MLERESERSKQCDRDTDPEEIFSRSREAAARGPSYPREATLRDRAIASARQIDLEEGKIVLSSRGWEEVPEDWRDDLLNIQRQKNFIRAQFEASRPTSYAEADAELQEVEFW